MIEYLPGLCDEALSLFERLGNRRYHEIAILADEDPTLALAKIAVLRGDGLEVPAFLLHIEQKLAPEGNYMNGLYEFHKKMVAGKNE